MIEWETEDAYLQAAGNQPDVLLLRCFDDANTASFAKNDDIASVLNLMPARCNYSLGAPKVQSCSELCTTLK